VAKSSVSKASTGAAPAVRPTVNGSRRFYDDFRRGKWGFHPAKWGFDREIWGLTEKK